LTRFFKKLEVAIAEHLEPVVLLVLLALTVPVLLTVLALLALVPSEQLVLSVLL
jgi:hypothetical protein